MATTDANEAVGFDLAWDAALANVIVQLEVYLELLLVPDILLAVDTDGAATGDRCW